MLNVKYFISEDNTTILNTPAGPPTGVAQSPTQISVAQSRKPRDFDREEAVRTKNFQGETENISKQWYAKAIERDEYYRRERYMNDFEKHNTNYC